MQKGTSTKSTTHHKIGKQNEQDRLTHVLHFLQIIIVFFQGREIILPFVKSIFQKRKQ